MHKTLITIISVCAAVYFVHIGMQAVLDAVQLDFQALQVKVTR